MGNLCCSLEWMVDAEISELRALRINNKTLVNKRLRELERLEHSIASCGSDKAALRMHFLRTKISIKDEVTTLLGIARTLDNHEMYLERLRNNIHVAEELEHSKDIISMAKRKLATLERTKSETEVMISSTDEAASCLQPCDTMTDEEVLKQDAIDRLPVAPRGTTQIKFKEYESLS